MALVALGLVIPVFWLVLSAIRLAGHVQRNWRPVLVGGLLLLGGATGVALLLHATDAPSYEEGDQTLRAMLDR
jgi:hypothetical protein